MKPPRFWTREQRKLKMEVLDAAERRIGDIYACWLSSRLDAQPDLLPVVDTLLRTCLTGARAKEAISALSRS